MFSAIDEPDHRRQLRETVASFAAREAGAKQIRTSLQATGAFDAVRWRTMADLGWLALLVPEQLGGIGLEIGDLAAFHHEIGRAALRDPLIEVPLLTMQALALSSNRDLADAVLPDLISGEKVATLAWQGRAGALIAADVGPQARKEGEGWVLSGTATFVPLATNADAAVVAARTADGVALFWIEALPAPTGSVVQADGSMRSTFDFSGLRVPAGHLIAGDDAGAGILDKVLDTARLGICAQLLGAMEQAFTMTVEHLKTRNQFGKPLASFQALQHRSVDMYVLIEMARSALMRAERELASGAVDAAAAISAAKSRCADAAMRVTRECIQLHGAIGYTEEYDLSLYVTRILTLAAQLGNARAHRARWFSTKVTGVSHAY